MMGPKEFVIDYIGRHKHPVNAAFHIVGVPMAFYGLYRLIAGDFILGVVLLFFGYLCQYLGHRAQGNEVGEVTLIKSILKKFGGKGV
jgi:hypothetical protein